MCLKNEFPCTVVIHQKYVDGADVECDGCLGTAFKAINLDSISICEVEFMGLDNKKHTYFFDKHNLEVIA